MRTPHYLATNRIFTEALAANNANEHNGVVVKVQMETVPLAVGWARHTLRSLSHRGYRKR